MSFGGFLDTTFLYPKSDAFLPEQKMLSADPCCSAVLTPNSLESSLPGK